MSGNAEVAVDASPNRRRQLFLGMLSVAAIALVFFGILPQFTDYREAVSAARGLPALWLVALGLTTAASIGIYGLQWKAPLPELNYPASFRIANTSFMVSNGIPGGGALVLPTQYAMLAMKSARRLGANVDHGGHVGRHHRRCRPGPGRSVDALPAVEQPRYPERERRDPA